MARYRKGSGNTLPRNPNAGLAKIKNQRFNQAVPKQVSSMEGISVPAGDLTQAFNNFFGKVQDSLGNVNSAYWAVEKIDAEKYANKMKDKAKADAYSYTRENKVDPKNQSTYVSTALENNPETNTHYIDSYKTSLGKNLGFSMWNDFSAEAVNQPPENFDSFANDWWSRKWGSGTGDMLTDTAAQHSFQSNLHEASLKAKLETVKLQNSDKLNQIMQNAGYGYANNDLEGEYASIYQKLKTQFPFLNSSLQDGNVRTQALSILLSHATKPGDYEKLMTFLNKDLFQKEGEKGVPGAKLFSMVELFPNEVIPITQKLMEKHQKFSTMAGSTAVSGWNSKFDTMVATIGSDFETKVKAYSSLIAGKSFSYTSSSGEEVTVPSINELYNQFGVSGSQFQAVKGKISEEFNKVVTDIVGINKIQKYSIPGSTSDVSLDTLKNHGGNYLTQVESQTGKSAFHPDNLTQTSTFINKAYQKYGVSAFNDEVKGMFADALLVNDTQINSAAFQALAGIDKTGLQGQEILKGHPLALAKFNTALVSTTTQDLTQYNFANVNNNENYRLAYSQVTDTKNGGSPLEGFHTIYINGGVKASTKDYQKWETSFLDSVMSQFDDPDGFLFFGNLEFDNVESTAQDTIKNYVVTLGLNASLNGVKPTATNIGKDLQKLISQSDALWYNHANNRLELSNTKPVMGGYYGPKVMNPQTMEKENTYKNATDLIEDIDQYFNKYDGDNFTISFSDPNVSRYGYAKVVNRGSSMVTGTDLVLGIGEQNKFDVNYDVNEGDDILYYNSKGEAITTPGRQRRYFSFDDTESFHFTGNYEQDRIAFKKWAHPAMDIIPINKLDEGQSYLIPGEKDDVGIKVPITGYSLVIKPFFKETSDKYLTNEKIKELAK